MNNPAPTTKSLSPVEQIDGCVESALHIMGNKWTALIIRDLSSGNRRFCGLENSLNGISPRTLSQRLVDLESHGIISKQRFAEVPPRCEYSLTEKGEALLPILRQMAAWGERYPKNCTSDIKTSE